MGWDDWRGEAGDSPRAPTSKNQVLPLIHTDDTDRKGKTKHPPRRHGDAENSKAIGAEIAEGFNAQTHAKMG
jgi:hypothetical protein